MVQKFAMLFQIVYNKIIFLFFSASHKSIIITWFPFFFHLIFDQKIDRNFGLRELLRKVLIGEDLVMQIKAEKFPLIALLIAKLFTFIIYRTNTKNFELKLRFYVKILFPKNISSFEVVDGIEELKLNVQEHLR